MNRRIIFLIYAVLTVVIILELLPLGAVTVTVTSRNEAKVNTYSYFSLVPYGLGNPSPIFTGIFTIMLFFLITIQILTNRIKKLLACISILATIMSVVPALYSVEYYNRIGLVISILLLFLSIVIFGWLWHMQL